MEFRKIGTRLRCRVFKLRRRREKRLHSRNLQAIQPMQDRSIGHCRAVA